MSLPADPRTSVPRTAPPVHRTPMRAAPWFGLCRGLLFAAWPGHRFPRSAAPAPAWQAAATRRRRLLLLCVGALAALALALQWPGLPAQPSVADLAYTALMTLLFAWVGVGFVTALMGAWVLLRGDRHALAPPAPHVPIDPQARTALLMTICNEDIATVFAGLRATCESLAATGALALFDVFILSDTSDPALRAAELQAWQRLREGLGDDAPGEGGRVFYRWRRRRTRRKAGNVADFCRRWGRDYRYMVVLDADSTMHGDTLVALVRLMERHPRAGILQTLPQACGQTTLHARAQQFASRVYGRLFALGMGFWQLGDAHYWGHNAILRVQPFMRHCALARLPGRGGLGGDILSHDFVEAALMGRAGCEVWLVPALGGSWEQTPPNLLDELQRDRRWCQGNLQNLRLVAEPGWRAAHRAMFATGALSYAVAPLWLGFIVAGGFATLAGQGAALWALTLTLLALPRALGVAAVLARGEAPAYGGALRLAAGAVLELALSTLQAPVRMLAHSAFVAGALTGLRLDWKSPPRDAVAVPWGLALRRIGTLALLPLAAGAAALRSRGALAWSLLPMLLPLLLSVPLAVFSGRPRGAGLGLLRIPEEQRPPATLARAAQQRGFLDLVPVAARSLQSARPVASRRPAMALAAAALTAFALLPRPGFTPELPPGWRDRMPPVVDFRATELASAAIQVATPAPVRRTLRERPARRIDDALRRRALEAVERALAQDGSAG